MAYGDGYAGGYSGVAQAAPTFIFQPPIGFDNPPVLPDTRGVQYRLFRHFDNRPVGHTVLKTNGTYWTAGPYPLSSDLEAAEEIYYGGHVYTISADTAAALTADGYGAYIA